MKATIPLLLIFFLSLTFLSNSQTSGKYTLVIHGGAGNITPANLPAAKAAEFEAKLTEVLKHGDSILKAGGTSLDAVESCVRMMENSPLFNAGKGAVFNADGKNELDAAIMDGKTGLAGAVAGVKTIRNPITAARAVMEKSNHVMLSGIGAETFAAEQGLEIVSPEYFFTQLRWDAYMKAKANSDSLDALDKKHGTVGCVAVDQLGNLAAATSTGGMTYKKYGRIGDTPVIGAGTYADNNTCAVSATGHGEFFIRNVVAYDIAAIMKYKGSTLTEAANEVVMIKLKTLGGIGGIIAVDKTGNIAMPFNTSGMFRGYIKSGGEIKVAMFGEK
ncbi:MAG: isoaspartyl peptidase/L-asparaginase [Bacteroidales bacterium]|nr:isoaspartyl peptidase/L-asparaginase [Bacteroidales bacterium]